MSKLSLVLNQWLRQRVRNRAQSHSNGDAGGAESLSCDRLFQASAAPVLIVDATSDKIVDGNPAAAALFRTLPSTLMGTLFLEAFAAASSQTLQFALATARTLGTAAATDVRSHAGAALTLTLSLFRTATGPYLLVHPAAAAHPPIKRPSVALSSPVFDAIDEASVGFLIADSNFRVDYANRGFVRMVNLPSPEEMRGAPLTRWLTLSDDHLTDLHQQRLNRHAVGELNTTLRTQQDAVRRVEVSAIAVPDGQQTWWGFCVREVARLH